MRCADAGTAARKATTPSGCRSACCSSDPVPGNLVQSARRRPVRLHRGEHRDGRLALPAAAPRAGALPAPAAPRLCLPRAAAAAVPLSEWCDVEEDATLGCRRARSTRRARAKPWRAPSSRATPTRTSSAAAVVCAHQGLPRGVRPPLVHGDALLDDAEQITRYCLHRMSNVLNSRARRRTASPTTSAARARSSATRRASSSTCTTASSRRTRAASTCARSPSGRRRRPRERGRRGARGARRRAGLYQRHNSNLNATNPDVGARALEADLHARHPPQREDAARRPHRMRRVRAALRVRRARRSDDQPRSLLPEPTAGRGAMTACACLRNASFISSPTRQLAFFLPPLRSFHSATSAGVNVSAFFVQPRTGRRTLRSPRQ